MLKTRRMQRFANLRHLQFIGVDLSDALVKYVLS